MVNLDAMLCWGDAFLISRLVVPPRGPPKMWLGSPKKHKNKRPLWPFVAPGPCALRLQAEKKYAVEGPRTRNFP
jgi:hypothetical protein